MTGILTLIFSALIVFVWLLAWTYLLATLIDFHKTNDDNAQGV